MTTKNFNADVAEDWRRGVAAGLLRARQAEIDDYVSNLLRQPPLDAQEAAQVENDGKPVHLDLCVCEAVWPCTDQHITGLENGLPLWSTLPEGDIFPQQRCLLCADPFEGFS